MSTSIEAADGTWATLPMGRLDESLNTFWQLFFRPTPTARWSNEVEATATATNGGLVLAAGTEGRLVVGIRPSSYLTYSPIISASGAPTSWSSGLIDAALAARPDALAVGPRGGALALVGGRRRGRDDPKVLASSGNLSLWATLTTQRALASTSGGRACDPTALTAVGYLGEEALVGTSCGRPGLVGLFVHQTKAWRLTHLALPASLARDWTEVLSVQSAPTSTSVLLALSRGLETDLLVARVRPKGRWTISAPRRLPADDVLASFGPADEGGFFALVQTPSGRDTLGVVQSTAVWKTLPTPPPDTATVAFGAGAPVEALVASATRLTVWSLDALTGQWMRGQVLHIPIQYGSSTQ